MVKLNILKNFISTNESKIYVESNQLSIEEQEQRQHGILFIPPNPQWKNSEDNVIMNNLFYALEKKYCVMKCVFQNYSSPLYSKIDTPNIQYVRDASMVVDEFFRHFNCVKRFTIIGYSWGCGVVLNLLMRRPEIVDFIFFSPTLTLKDCDWFNCLSIFRTTGMIIHGTEDNLTKIETVQKYVDLLRSKKMTIDFKVIEGADHYYRNHVPLITNIVEEFLKKTHLINHTSGITTPLTTNEPVDDTGE